MRSFSILIGMLTCLLPPPLAAALADPASAKLDPAASRLICEAATAMWRVHGSLAGSDRSPDPAVFSPDGKSFVAILVRGDVKRGVREFQLRRYSLIRNVQSDLVDGEPLVTFRTPGNVPAIDTVKWLNGDTVSFLGSPDGSNTQVYTLNVKTRRWACCTHAAAPVVAFGFSAEGSAIVYAARTRIDPELQERQDWMGIVAAPTDDGWHFASSETFGPDIEIFRADRDGKAADKLATIANGSLISAAHMFSRGTGIVRVSPDGRVALIGPYFDAAFPASWEKYASKDIRLFLDHGSPPPGYALIDLRTKAITPLPFPAVSISDLDAAWSPDGKRIFVSGYLPPDPSHPEWPEIDRARGGMLAFDPGTKDIRLIKRGLWRLIDIAAEGCRLRPADDSELAKRSRTDSAVRTTQIVRMKESGGIWQSLDQVEIPIAPINNWSQTATNGDLIVGVGESADVAPELVIVDVKDGTHRVITRLNPQLKELPRGRVAPVEFISAGVVKWPVHIVFPVGYEPGRRYPAVVMQMDRSYADTYVLDSRDYRAAYPAQALANRGFVVAMVYLSSDFFSFFTRPREREEVRQLADAVFAHLVSTGLADPEKIAMTGFSHAGWMTEYGIQRSKERYAAAVAIDNVSNSFMEYVMSNCDRMYERFFNDTNPFTDQGRAIWWSEAVGFNPARMKTPLLMETHGNELRASSAGNWDIYAALRRFEVPVEYVHYKAAIHIMRRVPEMLSSAERQIDWLCFWLKNEEDSDPKKAEQYARWREMRQKWKAAKAVTKDQKLN